MGHNLNLVAMLGLPERVTCPKCKAGSPPIDVYGVEFRRSLGDWRLLCRCWKCEHAWSHEVLLLTEQELEAAFDLTDRLCPECDDDLVLARRDDDWCFGCVGECIGFVVTAETLAGVMEKWREAVR